MRRVIAARWLAVMLTALLGAGLMQSAVAQESAARIVSVHGDVRVERAAAGQTVPASSGANLLPGDTLITGAGARAVLLLADETLIRLNRNTRFTLKTVDRSAGWARLARLLPAAQEGIESLYNLVRGELWLLNKNPRARIRIDTPSVTAGIRGTEVGIRVTPDGESTVTVLEGRALVSNERGAVEVGAGEAASAAIGAAPVKRILATPEDAVQWVITVPPGLRVAAPGDPDLAAAWRALDEGRPDEARALLESRPQSQASGSRLAFTALVAILQGRAADAERLSAAAVSGSPDRAEPWIVRAYALQSQLRLDEAEAALRRALAVDPSSLTAYLNLTEVLFGSDRLDEARAELARAAAIAPDDARVNAVTGFLDLADGGLDDALARFDGSLAKDPALADAWLGRALVLMRRGEPEGAFEAIASAIALEPRRSLFYVYWARMLYTLGRHDRALDMARRAAQLDPRDPTPVYLEALILRDGNHAVEAIQAYNRAVALNDNRAVYRSRYLLDQDLAVKNIDLSVLYDRLGLDAWARNKATNAVKRDFANFGGHLFLAGALAEDEDREFGLQSEFLLARLLQPANANTFNTFNQYTTLLDRPSLNAEVLAGAGSDGRAQGEVIAFGSLPESGVAFQAGVLHESTDGWHGANFEDLNSIAGVVKMDVTRDDGLLLTLSRTKLKRGDVEFPRFEFSAPRSPEDRGENSVRRVELGYRRRIGPEGNLLVYLARLENDGTSLVNTTTTVVPGFDLVNRARTRFERPYDQAQVQMDRRFGTHQLRAGWLHYTGDANADVGDTNFANLFGTVIPLPLFDTRTSNRLDVRHRSLYLQDTWDPAPWLTVDGAIYFDDLENADPTVGIEWSQSEVNPRLGLVLRPGPRDTVRLAAYRYLLPFVSARLDPTDVAGIAVFRNALEGALTREVSLAWEREWSDGFASASVFSLNRTAYAGALDATGNPVRTKLSARRRGLDVEVNQLLPHGLGLRGRYRFIDTEDRALPANDRNEHRVDLGLRFVRPSGWFGGVTTIARRMHLTRGRSDESAFDVDLDLGYELPGKRGELKLEVQNLFDANYDWITDRFSLVGEAPGRQVFGTLRLNF